MRSFLLGQLALVLSVAALIVAAGLLVVDTEGHGGLALGPDCRPVLRGWMVLAMVSPPRSRARTPGGHPRPAG